MTYQYVSIDHQTFADATTICWEPDSYCSIEAKTETVKSLFKAGWRVCATTPSHVILEREVEIIPTLQVRKL